MPDPTPPTPPVSPEQPPRHHHPHRHLFWRRVRVYILSLLLIGAIYFYAGARIIREHPQRVATEILSRLPFPSSVGHVQWLNASQLDLRDLKVGDFFYAAHVIITATPYQLLRHHIDKIDIRGAQFFTEKFNDALRQGGKSQGPGGLDWTISKLVISRGTLWLEEMAPDMPPIPVRLGITQPITLNYVKLGHPDQSPSMTHERTVDLENVVIVSPFDALSPVLSLPLIRVTFTYNELWKHHLRQVSVVRPVLHLGQDLFWFTDQFKKEHPATPNTGKGVDAPWQLGHFQVRYGQLAVNAFGQPAFQFPFFFDTDVDDVRLDQLDKVTARMVVPIEKFNADYTDYKIKIVELTGQLEFSIPPGDANANNVVPVVNIKELSWNGIAATDVSTSVTFDPTGIYGKLTGKCERGLLSGNFEIYYMKGFTWNADFFANTIDCAPIAEKMAGKYGTLTGTIDGQIGVQGKTTEITNCTGQLDLRKSGVLEISSADDLIKRLPGAKGSLQNQALTLAVDALRNYPYQTGGVKINYTPGGGVAALHLDGPSGKRDFSVYLHPYDDGTSNVAKASDSR
jgi:dicarboxylate transporter DctA-like protein